MKLFSKLKKLSRKSIVLGVAAAAIVGVGAFALAGADAQNISVGGTSENNANSVMYGGAHNVNQLIDKYESGDGVNSGGSIKEIYDHFGISKSDIKSMNNQGTKVIAGSVTASGNVLDDNGKIIATDALTAGRQDINPSTCYNMNTSRQFCTRPPHVSFTTNTIEAFIVLNDKGEFKFAILSPCGNPVSATPKKVEQPKTPAYNIEKKVKVKGSGDDFSSHVHVEAGAHVIYSVVVRSTGDAPAKNVTINDNLPQHVKYVDGTLSRNGANVAAGRVNDFFGNGITVASIDAHNGVERFTFEAIVGPNDTPTHCEKETLTNRGHVDAQSLPPATSTADVTKECAPKPVYKCENLNALSLSRRGYRFKAQAVAHSGAQVMGYTFTFGDGTTKTITTHSHDAKIDHTYADVDTAKTYNTSVSVMVKVDGKIKTVTGNDCKAKVKVAGKPLAECTGLKLTVGENRSISTQVSVSTKNGAKLSSVTYNFDDGTSKLVNDTKAVAHTYAADGKYTVSATVTFTVKDKKLTSVCQAPVTFSSTPPCEEQNGGQTCETCQEHNGGQPCETCDESNNGQPCVTCEEQNGGQVCVESPTCEETVAEEGKGACEETPASLVNTGPGSAAAMFVAVTVLGSLGYRTVLSRRLGQM